MSGSRFGCCFGCWGGKGVRGIEAFEKRHGGDQHRAIDVWGWSIDDVVGRSDQSFVLQPVGFVVGELDVPRGWPFLGRDRPKIDKFCFVGEFLCFLLGFTLCRSL